MNARTNQRRLDESSLICLCFLHSLWLNTSFWWILWSETTKSKCVYGYVRIRYSFHSVKSFRDFNGSFWESVKMFFALFLFFLFNRNIPKCINYIMKHIDSHLMVIMLVKVNKTHYFEAAVWHMTTPHPPPPPPPPKLVPPHDAPGHNISILKSCDALCSFTLKYSPKNSLRCPVNHEQK